MIDERDINDYVKSIESERDRIVKSNIWMILGLMIPTFLIVFLFGVIYASSDSVLNKIMLFASVVILYLMTCKLIRSSAKNIFYETSLSNATRKKLDFDTVWKSMKKNLKEW